MKLICFCYLIKLSFLKEVNTSLKITFVIVLLYYLNFKYQPKSFNDKDLIKLKKTKIKLLNKMFKKYFQ